LYTSSFNFLKPRVGKLETWFFDNEEKIGVFLQERSRKHIDILKALNFSLLKEEILKGM